MTFTESITHYLEGIEGFSVGPCPGCDGCGLADCESMEDEAYELASEASFSWSACDSCGSTFGGDRFHAHGFLPDPEGMAADPMERVCHFSVCVDCLMFHANGDEPETWDRSPGEARERAAGGGA